MIEAERERQEVLHPLPKYKKDSDPDIQAVHTMIFVSEFLAVLVEEVGEVAKALQGEGNLIEELIHTSATAIRWLENLK